MVGVEKGIAALAGLDAEKLRDRWRRHYRNEPPPHLSRDLLTRAIAHRIQERAHGGLGNATVRKLRCLAEALETKGDAAFNPGIAVKPGAKLVREWHGEAHSVIVLEDGFDFNGQRYRSLSKIAHEITGAHWSGPRFFGLARAPKPFSGSMEACHE